MNPSRLDKETTFAVRSERAQRMIPHPVKIDSLRDYRDGIGHSMTRADTIREHLPEYESATPFESKAGTILEAFDPHPYVLEAIEDSEAGEEEVESRRERIGQLLSPESGPLEGEEMAVLIQDEEIGENTKQVTERLTNQTHYGELPDVKRYRRVWPTATARTLALDYAKALLIRQAFEMEEKPRERSTAQHVEHIGLDAVMEESPYFTQ